MKSKWTFFKKKQKIFKLKFKKRKLWLRNRDNNDSKALQTDSTLDSLQSFLNLETKNPHAKLTGPYLATISNPTPCSIRKPLRSTNQSQQYPRIKTKVNQTNYVKNNQRRICSQLHSKKSSKKFLKTHPGFKWWNKDPQHSPRTSKQESQKVSSIKATLKKLK